MISKIFCPNGIASSRVITKLARKEFGDNITECHSYVDLKNQIVKVLRKMSAKEFEENEIDTLVGIKHLEENDFGNFISVRLAYWGLIIAIAVMAIGDVPIYEYFNLSKKAFGIIICIILTILLVTMARIIHYQHDQLEYLNFKLICFDEVLGNRKNKFGVNFDS